MGLIVLPCREAHPNEKQITLERSEFADAAGRCGGGRRERMTRWRAQSG
jgi:hypothetical protein